MIRGDVALVLVDDQWVTAERVEDSWVETWRAAKVSGRTGTPGSRATTARTLAGGSLASGRASRGTGSSSSRASRSADRGSLRSS